MTAQVAIAVLLDRSSYRRGRLLKSLRRLRKAPFLRRELWHRLREYNMPGFHPDDRDTTELVTTWRAELFGDAGSLNDKLVTAVAS
jgi:predicted metal-dependent hydrolase